MSSLHVSDTNVSVGIKFVDASQVAIDVSGYSTLEILIQDEAGTTSTVTASFRTDGTDGIIEYASVAGTFDTAGTYRLQGKISDGVTTIFSDIVLLQVLPNLA